MRFSRNLKAVVFVGGPTGSGKTTLVQLLAGYGTTYEERGEDNPYLMRFLRTGELDAVSNQEWFLSRIEAFLAQATAAIAIVDQHPLGIGEAYTKLYQHQGMITPAAANGLVHRACSIYDSLAAAEVRTLTVQLTASSTVLWQRVLSRPRPPKLSSEAMATANKYFQTLVFSTPCLPINSEVLSPQEEMEPVLAWLSSVEPAP